MKKTRYNWTTPIRYIRGLGPVRSRELTKIRINTVGDLLERQPLSYVYPGITDIADTKDGMVVIHTKIKSLGRGWGSAVVGVLEDKTGSCEVIWYHNAWAIQSLRVGLTIIFWGKMKGGILQNPKWTISPGCIKAVYGGWYGIHHQTIRAALDEVLTNTDLPDLHSGGSRIEVYQMFHFPKDKEEQVRALQVLKKDEALTTQLALAERRRGRGEAQPVVGINHGVDKQIMAYFPYEFTTDQNNAIISIIADISGHTPMQRLIHGEVGSGKTAIAFYVAMLAALNGKRTLILCPTTILADQHYRTLLSLGWDDVGLYSGNKQGSEWYTSQITIGTHAISNNDYLVDTASLVIIDEFQKFGVEQRAKIQRHHPHLLLMSATPIPRTLAATVFGDLDVSAIRELPIKRGVVITKRVLPEDRETMYEIIEKELVKGHQVYIVYPRISGAEDVASAERGFSEISYRFGMYRVKLLTGQATAADKAGVLHEFYGGDTQILVSTIIAEVGLDNPNATVMTIEGADRFGLSQLHQLRGRVCRSTDTAFCFLASETANPTSIARLTVIEGTNDGFLIAEEDIRLRGAGEVFSTRQTGLPSLKWCNLVDNYDLMVEAKNIVQSGSVGEGPKEMMLLKYGENMSLGGIV